MSTEALLYWITRFGSIRHVAVVCITITNALSSAGLGRVPEFPTQRGANVQKNINQAQTKIL